MKFLLQRRVGKYSDKKTLSTLISALQLIQNFKRNKVSSQFTLNELTVSKACLSWIQSITPESDHEVTYIHVKSSRNKCFSLIPMQISTHILRANAGTDLINI